MKHVSNRIRLLYTSLLLVVAVLILFGPAQAGTINFYSAGFWLTSTSGPVYTTNTAGDGDSSLSTVTYNGYPGTFSVTAGRIVCGSPEGFTIEAISGCSGTLEMQAYVTGIDANDPFYLILDGTTSGSTGFTLDFGGQIGNTTIDSQSIPINNNQFNFTLAPASLEAGSAILRAYLDFTMPYDSSINLPDSATVQVGAVGAGVPEPGTAGLLAFGAAGLFALIRRRRA